MMKVNAKGKKVEVLLYDPVDSLFGVSAKALAGELKAAGDIREINVRINSPGGDVFEGIAIANQLRSHPAKVTVDIDGLAASIASVIAMAGDEIRAQADAFVMIHDPWALTMGTADELRKQAEVLDKIRGTILDTYVNHAGEDARKALDAAMAEETWYTAEEALDAGLVDSVTPALEMAARVDESLKACRHMPERLAALLKQLEVKNQAEPELPPMDERLAHLNRVARRLRMGGRLHTMSDL